MQSLEKWLKRTANRTIVAINVVTKIRFRSGRCSVNVDSTRNCGLYFVRSYNKYKGKIYLCYCSYDDC